MWCVKRTSLPFLASLVFAACGGGGETPPAPTPTAPTLAPYAGHFGGAGNLDGVAQIARLETPHGVAVDANGNRYVSDPTNHTIRRITADGTVSTLIGRSGEAGNIDGSGAEVRLREPKGLTVFGRSLFVVDAGNRMIRRLDLDTTRVDTIAGNLETDPTGADGTAGRNGSARFVAPESITVGEQGQALFVSDRGTVRRIDLVTNAVTTAAGTLNVVDCASPTPTAVVPAATTMCRPVGLAFRAGDPRLFIGDAGRHAVRAIVPGNGGLVAAANNTLEFVAGALDRQQATVDGLGAQARFAFPDSIVAQTDGSLIVGQVNALRRIRLTGEGARVDTLAGSKSEESGSNDGPGADARFGRGLSGLAIEGNGQVLVADHINHLLRRFDPVSVSVTTTAGQRSESGSDDGAPASARFFEPSGISFAADGSAMLVDTVGERVRRVDATGTQVTTVAQTPVESAPVAIDAGSSSRPPAIVGRSDHSVRLIQGESARLFAGSGVVDDAGFADGIVAAARFDSPHGVARDAAGTLWIADRDNHRIRNVSLSGAASTFAGRAQPGLVDGPATLAQFDRPVAIAVAPSGDKFVIDAGNRAIRRIGKDAAGVDVVSTVAQGLTDPRGIAVDDAGNLYVIDATEQTVRRFSPGASEGQVIVGTPGQCGFASGALPGAICRPRGIAVRGDRMLLTFDRGVAVVEPLPR